MKMASRGKGDKQKHGRHGKRRAPQDLSTDRSIDVNESSPLIIAFQGFQSELDSKYDKYEQLVRCGRDTTIESKRVIFLLHRVAGCLNPQSILQEAEGKLTEIEHSLIKKIAQQLENEDFYLYLHAISPGLQEYIEALSFYHYLKTASLISFTAVQERLQFAKQEPLENLVEAQTLSDTSDVIKLPLQQAEYMLGIADMTGELMRLAITSLGTGDIELPFELCAFLRQISNGFLAVGTCSSKEIGRKMFTLKQSLRKVETACYNLKVRGSEIPKHMLAGVFNREPMEMEDVNFV